MSITRQACHLQSVDRFKIISVRDEIIIGIADDDSTQVEGHDACAVARALLVHGELTVWQYVVRRGDDGDLVLAPLECVSILNHERLRVEPCATELCDLKVSEQ